MAALLWLLHAAAAAAAATSTGWKPPPVSIGPTATPSERFAAQELSRYLGNMSGSPVAVHVLQPGQVRASVIRKLSGRSSLSVQMSAAFLLLCCVACCSAMMRAAHRLPHCRGRLRCSAVHLEARTSGHGR
jgi:hypothetical protein